MKLITLFSLFLTVQVGAVDFQKVQECDYLTLTRNLRSFDVFEDYNVILKKGDIVQVHTISQEIVSPTGHIPAILENQIGFRSTVKTKKKEFQRTFILKSLSDNFEYLKFFDILTSLPAQDSKIYSSENCINK